MKISMRQRINIPRTSSRPSVHQDGTLNASCGGQHESGSLARDQDSTAPICIARNKPAKSRLRIYHDGLFVPWWYWETSDQSLPFRNAFGAYGAEDNNPADDTGSINLAEDIVEIVEPESERSQSQFQTETVETNNYSDSYDLEHLCQAPIRQARSPAPSYVRLRPGNNRRLIHVRPAHKEDIPCELQSQNRDAYNVNRSRYLANGNVEQNDDGDLREIEAILQRRRDRRLNAQQQESPAQCHRDRLHDSG